MIDLSYIIQDMTDKIETIKWDSKEYKMPFKANYFKQKADKFKELIIVRNRFSNEPALLPWFAVAVYDVIVGRNKLKTTTQCIKALHGFKNTFLNNTGSY